MDRTLGTTTLDSVLVKRCQSLSEIFSKEKSESAITLAHSSVSKAHVGMIYRVLYFLGGLDFHTDSGGKMPLRLLMDWGSNEVSGDEALCIIRFLWAHGLAEGNKKWWAMKQLQVHSTSSLFLLIWFILWFSYCFAHFMIFFLLSIGRWFQNRHECQLF